MELKQFIHTISQSDYKHSDTKIEQKTRNKLRTQLLECLKETLEQEIDGQDCEVLITEKGLTLVVSNTGKLGIIPIELTPVFKNLDFDPYASADMRAIAIERSLERQKARSEQARKRKMQQQLAREKREKITAKVKSNRARELK